MRRPVRVRTAVSHRGTPLWNAPTSSYSNRGSHRGTPPWNAPTSSHSNRGFASPSTTYAQVRVRTVPLASQHAFDSARAGSSSNCTFRAAARLRQRARGFEFELYLSRHGTPSTQGARKLRAQRGESG